MWIQTPEDDTNYLLDVLMENGHMSFYSALSNNPTCWISFVCFDSYRLHLCPAAVHVGQLKCNKSIKSGVQNSTLRCQTLRLLFTLSYTQLAFLIFLVHGLYCKISGNKYQGEIVGLSQKYQVKSVKLPHMKLWNHQLFCMLAWKKAFFCCFKYLINYGS